MQSGLFNKPFGLDNTSKNGILQGHLRQFIPVPLLFASESVYHRLKQNNTQNLRNQDTKGENGRFVNVQVNQ
jgi:hypothetical protein